MLNAADKLLVASKTFEACGPITEIVKDISIEEAYAIQNLNATRRMQDGAKKIGAKIGLTAKKVQEQLGVDQPDYGFLFDDMLVKSGERIALNKLMQPKIECEIAFILSDSIEEKVDSIDALRSKIEKACITLEIAESRIADWNIKIEDTIADNASAGHFVLSENYFKLEEIDLLNCKMELKYNGIVESKGVGKNCLGSPLNAVAWLANMMIEMENPLQKNDIVLSGALGPMINVDGPGEFVGEIEGLGKTSVIIF